MTTIEREEYSTQRSLKLEASQPLVDGVCLRNPPFASNLIFELSLSDQSGKYFLSVYYNGDLVKTSKVCGSQMNSDGSCQYSDFVDSIKLNLLFYNKTIYQLCNIAPPNDGNTYNKVVM